MKDKEILDKVMASMTQCLRSCGNTADKIKKQKLVQAKACTELSNDLNKAIQLLKMIPDLQEQAKTAKSYAEEAAKNDGGLDICDIGYRTDYDRATALIEKIDEILTTNCQVK